MLVTLVGTAILVAMVVSIHYETLRGLSKVLPSLHIKDRSRTVIGVLGALTAHIVEIILFACGYFLLIKYGGAGTFNGDFSQTFADCIYYSFVTYTTLGFGDITPTEGLRFLTGMEALTGLVLITWTASFLFIQMESYWRAR